MRLFGYSTVLDYNDTTLRRDGWGRQLGNAADRSRGGATEINIEHFGANGHGILSYITARCTGVKRVRLMDCYNISFQGLYEAATQLPLLQELELCYCITSRDTLEAVGLNCPLLKSLKLRKPGFRQPHMEDNRDAMAIARTMPGLRRLQLIGNKLTDKGLKAILDGCPRLESLDLRQCYNIKISGSLWKRCTERIVDLRRPYEYDDDHAFLEKLRGDFFLLAHPLPGGFWDVNMLPDDNGNDN